MACIAMNLLPVTTQVDTLASNAYSLSMFMVSRAHKNQAHSLWDTDLELWIKEAATKNHTT
jgi:hypothetical protein